MKMKLCLSTRVLIHIYLLFFWDFFLYLVIRSVVFKIIIVFGFFFSSGVPFLRDEVKKGVYDRVGVAKQVPIHDPFTTRGYPLHD